jgi:hypothetical protein
MQSLAVLLALVVAALVVAEANAWDGYLRIYNDYTESMFLTYHHEYKVDWHAPLPFRIAPGEFADYNMGYTDNSKDPSAFDLYFNLGTCEGDVWPAVCSWTCYDPNNPNGACLHVYANAIRIDSYLSFHATAWLTLDNGNVYTFDTWKADLHISPHIEKPRQRLPPPPTAQPTTVQPTTAQPTIAQPTTAQPTTLQPTTLQPTTLQPTTARPTLAQPTTAQPTTAQPTTLQPTTLQPTTA